jgi:HSP20 family molecular chaperone IbpA
MRKQKTIWKAVVAGSVFALAVPALTHGQAGSGGIGTEDRTGTTGPSGTRSFTPSGGGVDATARVAKPAEDFAATTVDRDLAARIRVALSGDSALPVTQDNVHLSVNNGTVTLHGQVKSEQEKEAVAAKVRGIAGVQRVENQLQIASGANASGVSPAR